MLLLIYLILILFKGNDGCSSLTMSQDTTFILDSGSYISSTEWTQVTTFVSTILNSFSTSSTYTASIYRYGDETISAYSADASFATISSAKTTVTSLAQYVTTPPSISKPNGREAIRVAMAAHAARTATIRRVMLVIAAEESVIEVCTLYPRENDIFFYVIAVNSTGWYVDSWDCMVTQRSTKSTAIQKLDSFGDLSGTLSTTLTLLCPATPIVKVTEVKPNPTDALPTFVELKNYGPAIALSTTTITLSPIFSGNIRAAGTLSWAQGSILVIYENSGQIDCSACSCTLSSTYYCSSAVYLKCGGSSATVGSYASTCSIGTSSATSWSLTLTVGGITVETLTYNNDVYWPLGSSGYSYELKYNIWEAKYGSSWVRSCTTAGTPGVQHTVCSSITCSSSNDYGNENTCDTAPVPKNCVGLIIDATAGSSITRYRWDLADYDGRHAYRGTYCPYSATSSADCTTQGTLTGASEDNLAESVSYTAMSIATKPDTWPSNDLSASVLCTRGTIQPSVSPTTSPTYSSPVMGSCIVYVDLPSSGFFTVTWTKETVGSNGPPSGSQYYNIYYNENPETVSNPNVADTATKDETSTVIAQSFISGTDKAYVEVVYPNGIGYSDSVECTSTTIAPSKKPTSNPTKSPVPGITSNPTKSPTPNPTYSNVVVNSCSIVMAGGSSDEAIITWTATFATDSAKQSETYFQVAWNSGANSLIIFKSQTSPASKTFSPALVVGTSVVTIRPKWDINDPINGVESGQGSEFTCTLSSDTPTKSPTRSPSKSPIFSPTVAPFPAPTGFPSHAPTKAPTYNVPTVTYCQVSFDQARTIFEAVFDMIDNDPSGITTPSENNIKYIFEFNNGETVERSHAQLSCNDTSSSPPCLTTFSGGLAAPWVYSRDDGLYPKFYINFLNSNSVLKATTNDILCSVVTLQPTPAPSPAPSKAPTPAPLVGEVYLYFEADMCDVSSTVSNPIASDRCNCTTYENCNNDYAPIIQISEQERPITTPITIKRSEIVYRYNISITYQIDFIDNVTRLDSGYRWDIAYPIYESRIGKINYTFPSENFAAEDRPKAKDPGLYIDDVETATYETDRENSWTDQTIIYLKDDVTTDINLGIYTEGVDSTKDSTDYYRTGEVFVITLTSCKVLPNPVGGIPGDLKNCSIVWPNRLFVVIEDTDPVRFEKTKTVTDDSWQDWFWYVLIAIIIFLLFLGYFVYRWWVNNKMKEAEVEEAEEDIDNVVKEQEGGFGNDIDDNNVHVNPLSTDVQRMKNQGRDVMTNDNPKDPDEIQDKADVKVERFNVKQEFGPTLQSRQQN